MSTTIQAEASKPQKKMQECNLENLTYDQIWYRQNKERILARVKEYQARNKEKILAQKRQYRLENRIVIAWRAKERRNANLDEFRKRDRIYKHKRVEQIRVYRVQYYNRLRNALFQILGGPFSDIRCLQFDHISNDGYLNRGKYRQNDSFLFLIRYIKNPEEAKQKLQVLCANCNWRKRYDGGEIQ